jgi:hypothetical protein
MDTNGSTTDFERPTDVDQEVHLEIDCRHWLSVPGFAEWHSKRPTSKAEEEVHPKP